MLLCQITGVSAAFPTKQGCSIRTTEREIGPGVVAGFSAVNLPNAAVALCGARGCPLEQIVQLVRRVAVLSAPNCRTSSPLFGCRSCYPPNVLPVKLLPPTLFF